MSEEEGIATAPSYTWYITNFSKLTIKYIYSDIFVADGYKWRLLVFPKGNRVKHLSLYLDVPDSSTLPDGWSRDVESFSIAVVNQICPKDSIKKNSEHWRFDAKGSAWGFSNFIPLADIHGPAKGYLVADTLVVEVRVSDSAESTSNLLMRSKNLLAEVSSMNKTQSSISSSEISESNQNDIQSEMAEEEGIATAPSYTWYITNFSKLTIDNLYSDIFVADGYKWRLLVFPKGNGVKHLSLYLDVPDSSTLPDGWSRDVKSFSFTVVNQICPKDSIKRSGTKFSFQPNSADTKHRFAAEEPDWGFKHFIPLADIHGPAKGYLVADTLVVEVGVSDSAESSSNLMMRSKNLLAEVSSMNKTQSSTSSSEISESNLPLNRQSLQQQRKALQDYLALSLEANELANAFDEIERISLQLVQHSPNSLEKTILKDLVSRLPSFKEILPATKSTIENMNARRKTLSGKSVDVGSRLGQGQGQLSSLEAKYSVLSEEELRLDAEILCLITQKKGLLIRKNSVAIDLKKVSDQVSTDLEEWKDIGKKTEEADQDWLQAREELARANLSWKLFQQNLELFQKSG